jgi:predicted DNA-binding protein
MNKAVQIRMPIEVWDHLNSLAEKRGPGTKVTSLIREAIHKTYFGNPLEEIAWQPPAQTRKKSASR